MNKQRHRLVFNPRRGQIMAVAESASCVGGAAKSSSIGLALSLVMVFSAGTQAQIVADPNAPGHQRPTVHSAPNGVPLVNIQTPTPAGVSRNTYRQFDVQSNGAILNNSRTQVQTQLGGWVQGNPWLATGSARIIVNEVNSSHPSLLQGHVEVAGERAQVIIANPSGIQVQGGGFINASRATLTTGRPLWNHGDLEGFRVQGGTIRIDGAGLDASSTDYTAILARAVEVNAGIWAKELTVVTGANDIADGRVEPLPSQATGAVPTYALDVAELGGMYAGKIHLIGTEVGLGVNLRGVVGATSGDVVIDASGKLYQRGTLQASGSVRVQASEAIHNSGDVYSGADLSMSTTQALTNSGRIDAASHLLLQAASMDNQAGARMAATADVEVRAEGPLSNQGEMVTAGQLLVRADALDNANGQLQGRRLDIDVRSLNNQQGSLWQTGTQAIQLTLGDLDNTQGRIGSNQPQDGGAPTGGGPGSGGGSGAPAGGGASGGGSAAPGGSTGSGSAVPELAPGLVQVSGPTLNRDGVVAAEGLIGASVQGMLNNTHGSVYVNRLDLRGAALDNTGGYIGARQAELNVDALSNTDGAIEAQKLLLTTARLDNTRGLLSASQEVQIVATERLNNAQGDIQSLQGDVQIGAGQLLNAGRVRSATDLTLLVDGELVNTGVLAAEGDATITAGSLASSGALAAGLHADGQLASEGDLKVTTTQTLQAGGLNLAAGALSMTGSALDLANSRTGARSQYLRATAGNVDTRGATVVAADLLSMDANSTPTQTLNNAGGSLSASQVRLQVANLDNTQGQISHTGTGELLITTPGRLENASGTITAVGTMTLQAQDLGNAGGRVVGGADVSVRSATLDNTVGGTVHASGDLLLRTGQLNNNGGTLQALGHVTAQGEGQSSTLLNREGLIRAGGTTDLSGQHIDNSQTRGDQQGIEGLNVSLSAATVLNQGGSVVASQDLTVTSTGNINNAQGQLSAGRTLSLLDPAALAGGTASLNINNTAGTLVADELVRVRAASVGLDGQILSRQDIDLQLVGHHTVAEGASVVANRHLTFKVNNGDLTNNGNLRAGKKLEVDARHITNNATGVIGAEIVRLRALENLVNRGLIDGVDTDVRARNLTNTATGRIYGEGVRVQSINDLTNEGNAVIAAHDTLQLGVGGTLTNRDGATLLSLGELAVGGALDADGEATGAAQAIHNRSALIESAGDMRLSAGQLNNLNDQLAYQVVPGESTSRTDYYTPIGYVGSEDVAWTAPTKVIMTNTGNTVILYSPYRLLVLPKTSAYAHPSYQAYYSGPEPFVPEHLWYTQGAGGDRNSRRIGDAFGYDRHSPVWQQFGLTAPAWDAPGERPQPRERINETLPPDPEATAAWMAAAAPWQELQNRIDAFRAVVESELLTFDMYRTYTETSHAAQVTASKPAGILSGGKLELHVGGTTLNQDSSIVAGGNINLHGGSVVNRSTEVSAPTQRTGTMNNWAVIGQDCDFGFGCDPVYGWASAPYAETVSRNVALGAVRFEQGVSPQAPSVQPGTFTPGSTQAQAQATGAVSQAPGGVPNAGPGAPLPGMASPPPLHDGAPDPVRIGAPNLTLPSSSLFQLHPGNTSGYLVETDPRFADRRQWLSSDYMLAALAVDPTTAQKRLGDGYYEQRLVREQVASLTGHRYLGDYTSDEHQYLALMNAGATFAQAHQLRPGIALSAAQVAALTSDIVWLVERSVTLPDGTTTLALVPQLYVRPQTGDLQPSGALLAGKNVSLQLSGDLINASGTIAGRQVTQITAANVHNLGGLITSGQVSAVSAAQDIRNIGGAIGAQDALVLDAGRDLLVQTTTAQGRGQAGAGTYSSQGIDRVAALYVSNPNGLLLASAGRDINLTAALVQSEGSVQLQAGRDISLDTVQTRTDIAVQRDDRNHAGVRQSEEIGTRISSEGGTSLIAGQDIQARAAQVQAQGHLALQAGRDVNIEAGRQSLATDNASFAQGKGFLSSGSTEVREHRSESHAVASNLGGEQVAIRSGQDTTVQGSNVIGDHGLAVQAGRDLNIAAAQTSRRESRFEENKSSGLFMSDGGINIGSQQHSTDLAIQSTGATGSTVGAITGDVNLAAGQNYRQVGSDVLAPGGDINVQAQSIEIKEARTTEQSRYEEKFKQSGLSIGAGGMIAAMQGMTQTLEAIDDTSDNRTKALGAAAAALQVKSAADGVQDALAKGATPTEAALSINISIGSSSSHSTSQSQSDSAQGSTVQAGGDVNLVASARSVRPEPVEGLSPGDILIRGSKVSAGGTARLSADGDIDLVSAQNTAEQSHQSSSKSGSVGIGIGANGISFNASASKSKGKGDGEETTHTNTRIEAGERVLIESGANTTLQGAVVAAPQVQALVGGDLKIESVQDKATYQESSQSSGFSVSVCIPPICYGASSASVSAGSTKIDSNYESVNEQSAIRAGDGGFQVQVDGATELIGGAITSTQAAVDANANSLTTGTLISMDVQNTAHTHAESSGVTLSTDMLNQGKYGAAKAVIGNALNNANESGNSSGETLATVSGANITITDESAQQAMTGQSAEEAVASLNRDSNVAHTAAQRQDAQAMKQSVETERAIKEDLIKAVTAFTDEAYRSRMQKEPTLLKVECPAGQDCTANPELLIRTPVTKEDVASAGPKSIIAVNGILNDQKRGAELAFQNTEPVFNEITQQREKPSVLYLMHIEPAHNSISELLGVAYEKIIASADYGLANFLGYTNAQVLHADLIESRGGAETVSLGHSRGTLVQEGAFTILANRPDSDGNTYTNPNLSVRGVGGAADAEMYSEKASKVLGPDGDKSQITYNYFSNDPVATSNLSGGNPGMWTLNDLWQVFNTNNSMHSCYGTGAAGCTQVEIPMPGGPQGTPEGNAKLIEYVGGKRKGTKETSSKIGGAE